MEITLVCLSIFVITGLYAISQCLKRIEIILLEIRGELE